MVYDFILYQGSTTEINQDLQKLFGIEGFIVLQLPEDLKNKFPVSIFRQFFFFIPIIIWMFI